MSDALKDEIIRELDEEVRKLRARAERAEAKVERLQYAFKLFHDDSNTADECFRAALAAMEATDE